jgi:hypothetical protein
LQLIGIFTFVLLVTFCETFPALFLTKLGPSNNTMVETQALVEFLGLDSVGETPPFIVIPTVS